MKDERTAEEKFADSVKDCLAIIHMLAPHFNDSVEELEASLKLSLDNEVHGRLLMSLVLKGKR